MADNLRCVLLLEPEIWRYSGFTKFFDERGVLVLDRAGASTLPEVAMLARTLLVSCGPAIIERIRSAHPGIPILVHGEPETAEAIATILAAGAQGYFVVTSPPAQLLDALRVVRDGDLWAPRMSVALLARPAAAPVEDEDPVLNLLLEGASNKEIAARLGLAEVTVKSRLTRLYKKYGVRTRLELVACVVRQRGISAA